jgi:threonine dehydrogenase-like Zn-dependent dehydrogenase
MSTRQPTWRLDELAELCRDRPGSIVIFGLGPEGLAAVDVAQDNGCAPIVVVDGDPSRLLSACQRGATHVIDPWADDPVAAVRELRPHGVRFAVDALGLPRTLTECLYCLAPFGTCLTAPEVPLEDSAAPLLRTRSLHRLANAIN